MKVIPKELEMSFYENEEGNFPVSLNERTIAILIPSNENKEEVWKYQRHDEEYFPRNTGALTFNEAAIFAYAFESGVVKGQDSIVNMFDWDAEDRVVS